MTPATAHPVPMMAATETFAVSNPFDGSRIAELPVVQPAQVDDTVAEARRARLAFRDSTPFERRRLLDQLADLVARDADKIASVLCAEVGKTIAEAQREVRRAQNTLRLSGDAATFLDGEVLHCGVVDGDTDRHAVVTYMPVGVVAAITPFNYPVNLLCHKLGPALAAGNAVVVKPSPKAPLAASHVVDLCQEAGMPRNLVQVVHGGAQTALALAQSPIDLLSFTGGPQAGLALKRASGLVRCLMELGGNDPLFVLPDADLDAAAKTAVAQRLEIAGQSCAAVKRLFVHRDVKKAFLDRVLALVAAITTGNPRDPATDMGPVIDAAAAQDIRDRLNEAVARGGRILSGGAVVGTRVAPTVIDRVDPETRLMATETFGPVLAVREFSKLEDAIDEVNGGPYGLQAGIFTNSHDRIRLLARRLQVGGLMVNEGPDFRAEHVPFGGVKQSGMGREGVRVAIREMSETRVVID